MLIMQPFKSKIAYVIKPMEPASFKKMKFAKVLDRKIDMSKISVVEVITFLKKSMKKALGWPDDLLIDLVVSYLKENRNPDPRLIQFKLAGFLTNKKARLFMENFWEHLISEQDLYNKNYKHMIGNPTDLKSLMGRGDGQGRFMPLKNVEESKIDIEIKLSSTVLDSRFKVWDMTGGMGDTVSSSCKASVSMIPSAKRQKPATKIKTKRKKTNKLITDKKLSEEKIKPQNKKPITSERKIANHSKGDIVFSIGDEQAIHKLVESTLKQVPMHTGSETAVRNQVKLLEEPEIISKLDIPSSVKVKLKNRSDLKKKLEVKKIPKRWNS